MQCFICVTYMFFICNAYPRRDVTLEPRSLFHDVIESLKIRAQLPEDTNRNDENNLGQIYERYGYNNEDIHLPNDAEFIPRRNDRIALPSLKYRIPKSLIVNETDPSGKSKDPGEKSKQDEIVIYISTTETPKVTTQKNKRKSTKQPTKDKTQGLGQLGDEGNKTFKVPVVNTMADQSHIGNKDFHMVVTPNIVVNFRTNENYQDGTIKVGDDKNVTNIIPDVIPQNVFNIHQEVKLDRDIMDGNSKKDENDLKRVKQEIKVVAREVKPKVEEDMMMCETATWNPDTNNRSGRKFKNIFQILLSI